MTREEAWKLVELLIDAEPETEEDELAVPEEIRDEFFKDVFREQTEEERRAYYAEKLGDCLNVWEEWEIDEARALGLDVSSVA